jgi:O-antigen/teichoic acid export membrane protein
MDKPNFRLLAQRAGLSGATNILVVFSSLIIIVVLTKRLSIEDFGAYSLISATMGLLPWLATLGLSYAMLRFLAGLTDKPAVQDVFYSSLAIVLITNALIAGVLFLLAREIAASLFNGNLLPALLLPVIFFLASLNIMFYAYFRAFQQVKAWSALSFIQAYATLALVSYFVLSGYGLQGAVFGLLIIQLFSGVILAGLVLRQIGFAVPTFKHTREHLAFGLPLIPQNLSSWITDSSDRYLIGIFLGTAAVGYYSPGYSLGSAIGLISAPLIIMLPPALSKYYEENNLNAVRTVLKYSWKYYFGIAIPCAVGMSVLSRPLLQILTTPDIAANGYLVTPLVAAGGLFLGGYEVVIIVIMLKKKTKISGAIWTVSAALNFGINLVLIPYLGIIGAALTTLMAFALAFFLTTAYSFRHFKFEIDGSYLLKSGCASIIMALFLLWMRPTGLASILVWIGPSAAIYLLIMFVLRGFTIEEVNFFYAFFTRPE